MDTRNLIGSWHSRLLRKASGVDLYVHYPCFDGIASGVLASEILISHGWRISDIHPVNYDVRPVWMQMDLRRPAAVVDFLYHPDAFFWADHHMTAYSATESSANSRAVPNQTALYDDTAPSCARILWNAFSKDVDLRRYFELVSWADKIDAARYSTPREAVYGDSPAQKISLGLAFGRSDDDCRELIRALQTQKLTLSEVSRLPSVQYRHQHAHARIKRGLRRFEAGMRIEDDGIVVFDVETTKCIVSRYAPYLYFPEALYSIGITRNENSAKITAMRNPWIEFPSIQLGKIFEHYGGGGHRRVAALIVANPDEASSVLQSILREMREEISRSRLLNGSLT